MARLDDERRIGAIQIDPLGDELRHVPPADPSRPVDLRPASPDQRALERGQAAAVRRADALTAKHRADAQKRRAERIDGSPKAQVTVLRHATQRPTDKEVENSLEIFGIKPPVRVLTQRAAIDVILPRQHRPRPQRLTHPEVSVDESQTLTQGAGLRTDMVGRAFSLSNSTNGDVMERLGDVPSAASDPRLNSDLRELAGVAEFAALSQPESLGHGGTIYGSGRPTSEEIADEVVERFEATLTAADPDS